MLTDIGRDNAVGLVEGIIYYSLTNARNRVCRNTSSVGHMMLHRRMLREESKLNQDEVLYVFASTCNSQK